MVGPDAFTEVRYLQHHKQTLALTLIPEFAAEFKSNSAATPAGCCAPIAAEDADTDRRRDGLGERHIKDTIDELRDDGFAIGLLTLVSFRPFPTDGDARSAGAARNNVVVVEKSLAVGMGGHWPPMSTMRCATIPGAPCAVLSSPGSADGRSCVVAARAVPASDEATVGWLVFPRPQREIVAKELDHVAHVRRSGPTAENVLRRLDPAGRRIGPP